MRCTIISPRQTGLGSKHCRMNPIGGIVAIKKRTNIDDDLFAHSHAALDRRRSKMRQHDNLWILEELWIDGGLVPEDVEPRACNFTGLDHARQSIFVYHFTARCVHDI